MRRIALAACAAALALAPGASPRAQVPAQLDLVTLVVLPIDRAFAFVAGEPRVAVGLGVWPPSRAPAGFLEELAALLRETVENEGTVVSVTGSRDRSHPGRALAEALGARRSREIGVPERGGVLGIALGSSAAGARRALRSGGVVLGVGDATPLLVGVTGGGGLVEGIARRPAIATPADVAATIVDGLGLETSTDGRVLRAEPSGDPLGEVEELAARLERDDHFGAGLTGVAAAFGLFGIGAAFGARRARRDDLGDAFVRAAAAVPLAWLIAIFVPHARWEVRAIPIAVLFLAALLPAARVASPGRVLLATAGALALLVIVAAFRPGAEPALSLWGNPLVSWRFFGLQNHLAAFLAAGALAGGVLLGVSPRALAFGALAVAALLGTPFLAANFLALLTIGFGAGVTIAFRAAGRLRPLHAAIAAGAATAATAAAMLADAGANVSHGGRAADEVISDGIGAAWRIFRDRAQLNIDSINDIGPIAWFVLVGLAVALSSIIAWAVRERDAPLNVRAGAAGLAAAALAAMVLEDTGFLTAGVLSLYPALVALSARPARAPASS